MALAQHFWFCLIDLALELQVWGPGTCISKQLGAQEHIFLEGSQEQLLLKEQPVL